MAEAVMKELSKLAETIDRVSREEQKQKLHCRCFLPTSPEDKEKLIWIQKLDTILSAITTTWNKTIVIAGDSNIGYNKPTALET